MAKIELGKDARDAAAKALSAYLQKELDLEVTGFDAVFLVDFITENLGPVFYNQGLHDAQAIVQSKVELIGEAIYGIEKPVKL
jgi:uncharacterized protein (DUF2164 family)